MPTIATDTYLGPARVQRAGNEHIDILLPDGPARATLALAAPYSPLPGDIVLVIGNAEYFVIGVIKGRNRVSLEAPGDLLLKAGGRIRLVGEQAIELTSPRMNIRTDRLETVAQAVFQRFVNSYTWVRGLAQLTTGRLRSMVEHTSFLSAERIIEQAQKDVSIDGEKIRLG
jgi:hypothetical protein